jgi:cell division protein FtsA
LRTVVGIDVGSSKTSTFVGEVEGEDTLRLIGAGVVASRGIRRGVVVDGPEAAAVIAQSVQMAEERSGYQIERAYVGVGGSHIRSAASRGVVGVSSRKEAVALPDAERALEVAQVAAVSDGRTALHVIPQRYRLDGRDVGFEPVGARGAVLELEALVVTGSSGAIQGLRNVLSEAGVEIDGLVAASLAAGSALLSEAEGEDGVALVDIGAGTTDIAVFGERAVWHVASLGIGGEHVTADVAAGLGVDFDTAEEVKILQGHARSGLVAPRERFDLKGNGGATKAVHRWRVAEIVEARVREILSMAAQEIRRSGRWDCLPQGVVLCGGTSLLPGLVELARELWGLPVRLGCVEQVEQQDGKVESAPQAAAVGLVEWGRTGTRAPVRPEADSGGERVLNWLRALLPS